MNGTCVCISFATNKYKDMSALDCLQHIQN